MSIQPMELLPLYPDASNGVVGEVTTGALSTEDYAPKLYDQHSLDLFETDLPLRPYDQNIDDVVHPTRELDEVLADPIVVYVKDTINIEPDNEYIDPEELEFLNTLVKDAILNARVRGDYLRRKVQFSPNLDEIQKRRKQPRATEGLIRERGIDRSTRTRRTLQGIASIVPAMKAVGSEVKQQAKDISREQKAVRLSLVSGNRR